MLGGRWGRRSDPETGARLRPARATPPPRPARLTRAEARVLNDRLMRLPRQDRRAVVRAVNRGRAVPDRRQAELAIAVAQRQQRFWRVAWLLAPVIAVVQGVVTDLPPEQVVLLAAWGASVLGAMAWWWWSRARRAELVNAVAAASRPGAAARRTHLPGGRALRGDGPAGAAEGSPSVRPPRPRGRKRRGGR
jgi:hypothetical protein